MASFPSAVKSFASRSAGQTIGSAHINDLQDEVTAIEDGLINGTAPLNSSNATFAHLSVTQSTLTIGATTYILPSTGGSSGQVLTIDSTSGSTNSVRWGPAPNSVLLRQVTSTDVNTTNVETTVFTASVPANTLGTTHGLRVTLLGDYLQNNGTQTLQLKVKYGATTIADTGAVSLGASATRGSVELRCLLMAANATNAQTAGGELLLGAVSSASNGGVMGGATRVHEHCTHVSVAEDSTASKTLAITVTHGASSINESCRIFGVFVELIS